MPGQRFHIFLCKPEGFKHLGVFADLAMLLTASLRSMGHQCSTGINELEGNATNILLNYQVLNNIGALGGVPYIVYQLEQLVENDPRFQTRWIPLLKEARQIWDYSPINIEFLRRAGIEGVRNLPIGFHPACATIQPAAQPDIDVLFYGSLNARRLHVLDQLKSHCRVERFFGLYGKQRNEVIARAKIVLNMHVSDNPPIFQQVRVSYLLNNGRFVISEPAPDNPYEGMLVTAPYDRLVETTLNYLQNDAERARIAEDGAKRFAQMEMTGLLRAVI